MLFSRRPPLASVAFNLRPISGPYGGGNQWVTQLARDLRQRGFAVRFDLQKPVDALLLTHAGTSGKLQFSPAEIAAYRQRHPRVKVIQRINDNDRRKGTTEMNALLAATHAVADHTVFVSEWLRDHHAGLWFDAARPHSVILNGADPRDFHPIGARVFSGHEPFRLVTHHWSDNWSKGFAVYQKIDELIATGALPDFQLTVIGRWPREIVWKSAQTLPPCSGPALGAALRQQHGYVTASLWEPGAMHPVEGLQCGLPLAFHADGGGTVELGRRFGVEFREDVGAALRELRARYHELRKTAISSAPSGDWMCLQYRQLLQRLLAT